MRISHVKISNILGIDELEFTPDGFNEISGQNGTGKTSVLAAIKSVIEGGVDATLLRKGADAGEVVLVLDDGTKIRKRVTPKTSPLDVTMPDGSKATRPTDIIKHLTDMLSVNPVDFLRAPKKDRARILLETMPIVADAGRLQQIAGVPVEASADSGLALIEKVRKQVFDDRTGTNRAIKEKDATINQLRAAMPPAPAGVEGSEDELRQKVSDADAARDAELDRISKKLASIKADNQSKIDKIRADAQAEIDRIKEKAAADIEAVRAAEREIEGKAGVQRERAITQHNAVTSPLASAIIAIVNNRESAAKREATLDTIKKMEGELRELQADADRQTKALDDIEAYKHELLADLPISGVEVVDGEIYRDGVQFDRLNTSQQVGIAVEIARLRAGDLGVVCVDGLELMDSQHYDELKDQARETGLQLFVTRVSDGPFSVKTNP